jgi:iron complex outermembrane receptor protein
MPTNTSTFQVSPVRKRKRQVVVAAAFGIGLPAAAATGQAVRDTASADSALRRLRPVVVTESRSAGVVGGAAAVVVRPEALRSSPAPLLEQALRESPFVLVRQNSRGEMELSVRGSDSRQAAVLVDGVPMTLGWDHRTDPSLVPVTGAQSLVIVRGLGSLLTGPNTLGGSIEVSHGNAVPSAPQMWGGAGVDQNSAVVASLGGARKLGDVGGGSFSLRGGFAHRDRKGVTLPNGATDPTSGDNDNLRTNSDLKETDGFASLRWGNASGRSLGVSVTAFNAERGVPPEEHIAAPRLWRYPYHTRTVTSVSGSTGTFTTPLGFASIDVGAGYNSGRVKISSYSNRQYQTVTAEELGDERTLTTRALLTHSLPKNASLRAALTTADVQYTETLSPAAGVDYRQKMWSAGGELDVPVGARTRLSGGMVLDNTNTPETGGRTPGQEPFDAIGWRGGIAHDLTGDVRLHASVSQRSRFPALRELYSGALNRFRPNPELKPETLLGFEGGLTMNRSFGGVHDATLQVIGFRHNLDDAIVRVTRSNPTHFMRVNRDRIQSTGAELLGGFVLGPSRDRGVSITGDALIQKIKVFDQTANSAQRHAENNPETRGTVELGIPLPLRLRGIANARYTGTQYCLNAETSQEVELKAQTESDIAVERNFSLSRGLFRSLRALVSFDNIGNQTVFDSCGLPQPGRTMRVMFSVR